MLPTRSIVGSGCLLFILLAGGFMFLLRACMSKYDERSAIMPAIVYGEDTSARIIAIVGFDETTSYQEGRGYVSKTVNTTYFLQSNDINTAQPIKKIKLKEHSAITEWPLKIMGTAPGLIWLFAGELMGIDPATLERICDIQSLEKQNSDLRGRFPKENKFYRYEPSDHNIYFTATDGTHWKLDHKTRLASNVPEIDAEALSKKISDSLSEKQKQLSIREDSLYQQYSRGPSQQYRQGKISFERYQAAEKMLSEQRSELKKEREQIRDAESKLRKAKQIVASRKSAISSIERTNPGYNQMYVNTDTLNGKWIGLYSDKERSSPDRYIRLNRLYDEVARRSIVTGNIVYEDDGDPVYDKDQPLEPGTEQFLTGGFLLDKTTAEPCRSKGGRRLIVHKNIIGQQGTIQVSMIDSTGKRLWTTETNLTSWFDWKIQPDKLIIFGQNNKELSGDEANLLIIIELEAGKKIEYDYFNDKN